MAVEIIWANTRNGYLSSRQTTKAQVSLPIHAVSPEHSLLAHTIKGLRGSFKQRATSLTLLSGHAHLKDFKPHRSLFSWDGSFHEQSPQKYCSWQSSLYLLICNFYSQHFALWQTFWICIVNLQLFSGRWLFYTNFQNLVRTLVAGLGLELTKPESAVGCQWFYFAHFTSEYRLLPNLNKFSFLKGGLA